MKKILLIIMLIFSIASCQNKQDKQNKMSSLNQSENNYIYTFKVSVANPYEIYLNDVPFDKSIEKGSINFELPINDLILKSGEQKIKIVLHSENDKNIDKIGLEHFKLDVMRYKSISEVGQNGFLVKEVKFTNIVSSPIVVKDDLVNIEIPYENIGWSLSSDLSNDNKEALKEEVLKKYNELKDVINKGDINSFFKMNKIRDNEVNTSFYNDKTLAKEDNDFVNERIMKSKGNMKSVENYSMKLYGNGKLVTLENPKGKSALYANDGKMNYTYFILLHRPKDGAPLEIIR